MKSIPTEGLRNIVFDLGNVLISYDPHKFHLSEGTTESQTSRYISDIYESEEWQMLDRGTICLQDAIDSIASKSTLSAEETASVFEMRNRLLFPLTDNTKLLKPLKKAGYRLFYLTNFPEDMFSLLSKTHRVFSLFEGGVVSSHVKLLKPEAAIYTHLTDKHGIEPSESLFIDDLQRNIDGAARLGFETLHLPDHRKLKQKLQSLFPSVFSGA